MRKKSTDIDEMLLQSRSAKFLYVSMMLSSFVLLLVVGMLVYMQFLQPEKAKAAGTSTYSEIWTATNAWYSGYDPGDGALIIPSLKHYRGFPTSGTTTCDMVVTPASCYLTVTQWSVAGSVTTP